MFDLTPFTQQTILLIELKNNVTICEQYIIMHLIKIRYDNLFPNRYEILPKNFFHLYLRYSHHSRLYHRTTFYIVTGLFLRSLCFHIRCNTIFSPKNYIRLPNLITTR